IWPVAPCGARGAPIRCWFQRAGADRSRARRWLSPPRRDRDRRAQQAVRQHAGPRRSGPARRARRGDGVSGAERLGEDHHHPSVDGPPAPQRGTRVDPGARLSCRRRGAQARRGLPARRAVPVPVPDRRRDAGAGGRAARLFRGRSAPAGRGLGRADRSGGGGARLHGHVLAGHEEAAGAGAGAGARAARADPRRADQRPGPGRRPPDADGDRRVRGRRADDLPVDAPPGRGRAPLPPRGDPAAGAAAGGGHARRAARALRRRPGDHAGGAVPADDRVTPVPPIGAARLARLLLRARLRSFRNGLRLRGRVRTPLLIATAALLTAAAYVGLFAQSFAVVVATVGPAAQAAALGTVAGLVAFGSWAAKAASSEALRAGSPENEFLLTRPITLGALVAGRGAADALTDPMGALFLFPVLFAASLVWGLPPLAWALAAVISVLVQLGISMLAYAAQVALVRVIPAARRRGAWVAMRLVSALALAALWMVGTGVLRDPAGLARRWGTPPGWLRWTPGGFIAAPLGAWARGDRAGVVAALGRLALAVAALVALAIAVARRAGLGGWEEAGASWADAAAAPPAARPITAGNKDLRLIVRDRTQLMVLIAMPAIFVGVQIFGAAGWTWSTASLVRVSCLSYSLALYMATIGPLTHMQAER